MSNPITDNMPEAFIRSTPAITRKAKPGNLTYCDEECTDEKCSESHNRREVVCRIDSDD